MNKKDYWFKHIWLTKKIGIRWVPANAKGWAVFVFEFIAIIYTYQNATLTAKTDQEFAMMFLGPLLVLVMLGVYLGMTRGEPIQ